jgi:hypothetical protein
MEHRVTNVSQNQYLTEQSEAFEGRLRFLLPEPARNKLVCGSRHGRPEAGLSKDPVVSGPGSVNR